MFMFLGQKSLWSSCVALTLCGVLGVARAAESGSKSKENSAGTGKGATAATPAPATKSAPKSAAKPVEKPAQKVLRGAAAAEAELEENARFEAARALAFEDAAVKKLREKAEGVTGEVEGTKALKEYFKALYGKMRSLEPALKERVDLTEAAALRQLDKPSAAK